MAPSVIISDIQMPGMNGFELVAEIRKLAGFESVPVIALSSLFSNGVRPVAAAEVFDACLAKPLHLDQLRRILGSSPPAKESNSNAVCHESLST
jgi:CheY-like chemotaxis protein